MANKITTFLRNVLGTEGLLDKTNYNLYELRRYQLIEHIMNDEEQGITTQKYCDHDIIVSLTTYGKRIYDVAFTIESIMEQTMKANKILLWLDYSFQNKELPRYLLKQQARGLEIAFCNDIRSYKKLIPSLIHYPDAAIITIDDDALYDSDLLERLIIPYLEDSKYIYCHRCHKITFNKEGKINPYNKWNFFSNDIEPSHLNFATGVGGVLYPPKSLDEDVKNESVFMDICQYADDVWFKAMSIKKGTLVKKVCSRSQNSEDYILNENVQDVGLWHININGESLNDKQLYNVFLKYDLFEKLNYEKNFK